MLPWLVVKEDVDAGSTKQVLLLYYLLVLAWRFRRQMPARLVPEKKPADLPPAPKRGPLFDVDLHEVEA